jgi:hypothetical protein
MKSSGPKKVLALILALSLQLNAAFTYADSTKPGELDESQTSLHPSIPGVNFDDIPTDEEGNVLQLPYQIQQIAETQTLAALYAPSWVKKLWSKPVQSYFGKKSDQVTDEKRARLYQDASRLFKFYTRQSKSEALKGFAEGRLKSFIMGLTPKKIFSAVRKGTAIITSPISTWTVEQLVVIQMLSQMTAQKNFTYHALAMVTAKNLVGASKTALTLSIVASVMYTLHYFGYDTPILIFGGGFVLGGLKHGPVAQLFNALTSWLLNPLNEGIKRFNARKTGGLEQWINNLIDSWIPQSGTTGEPTGNDRPRIANVEEDGTNFGGMTADDQMVNWEKNLRVWVAVCKRFGQLLRDTHHHGRSLMMMNWSDEQNATNLVEAMDIKLIVLNDAVETIMTPYKSAYVTRHEYAELEKFQKLYDEYKKLHESVWMNLNLTENEINEIESKIKVVTAELRKHMSPNAILKNYLKTK